MWLLDSAVSKSFERAYRHGPLPSAEQQMQYEARCRDSEGAALEISGDNAEIRITGVLTKRPHFLASFLGGGNTTYADIINALAVAENASDVSRIQLHVDSPGGQIDGLFDAIAAMQACTKPIFAYIENVAASAAYALVSQADEITANNRAVRVGSIGVIVNVEIEDDEVCISSSKAPKKAPDAATEAGRAIIREELDALHELFAEAIATGRGVSVATIDSDYGQGATLVADEALKRGMIDGIAGQSRATKTAVVRGNSKNPEVKTMDLATLRAQHPAVYAAAVQCGIDQERDRAVGHLNLALGSGLIDDAVQAISEGSELTHAITTKHMMAAINRRDQMNLADDGNQANAGDNAAHAAEGAEDMSAKVLSLVESRLGISE